MLSSRAMALPKESFQQLGSVLEFMRLLWGVDHALQSSSKRMGRALGVTGPQRLVIRIAGRFPGISAGRLAGYLRVHPSTLTGVLRRLEQRGFIERRADPADGRRALFFLTAKGRELDAMRTGTVEATIRKALAKFSEPDIETASRILAGISELLSP